VSDALNGNIQALDTTAQQKVGPRDCKSASNNICSCICANCVRGVQGLCHAAFVCKKHGAQHIQESISILQRNQEQWCVSRSSGIMSAHVWCSMYGAACMVPHFGLYEAGTAAGCAAA